MTKYAVWDGWLVLDETGRRKYLNNAELERFLYVANGFAPHRRALCHVLAYAGCRLSEALLLKAHQLDVTRETLTIATLKRRRRAVFRVVPVPRALVDMLRALPLYPDGRFWRMHRASAWRMVKLAMDLAVVAGPMASPKGLRHTFGIRAADCSIPPNLIQRWMGHASPTTTAIYLDAVGVEERHFAARMWPGA